MQMWMILKFFHPKKSDTIPRFCWLFLISNIPLKNWVAFEQINHLRKILIQVPSKGFYFF